MTKKLLALLLALCMVFSVCAFSVYAEETGDAADTTEATEATQTSSNEEDEPSSEEEDSVVEDSIVIDVENNYYPNDTVVVTGEVEGSITGVIVTITCKEDGVEESATLTVKKFVNDGYKFVLDDATVGAEYIVTVCDFANEDTVAEESFVIKKEATSGNTNKTQTSATGKVTIWIEGLTDRYIDKTTVSLKSVDDATVLGVAEYVLEEAGRNYRLNTKKTKIDRIATSASATSTTYLRDGYGTSSSTSKYFADCEWSYFVNGKSYSYSMEDMEVENGDEIIIYFGVPGEVIYPEITVEPENGITLNDTIVVTVTNSATDEPVKGAKVYFYKRNSTTKTGGSTDSNGVYDDKKANASFISTYQGGTVRVSGYVSASKPITMVSLDQDLLIERDGSAAAYVTIEGAHKTLLERTKSTKISEYDLFNFALEVFDDEDIEYELNNAKNNFEYIESSNTSGYSNENGEPTKDSGWYVCVNDTIYPPDYDLETIDIYADDEILFYFGDEDTIPLVYYKIVGDLETDEKVYVYFYSDKEMTDPLTDFDAYFEGNSIYKRLNTNSDGRVTLPTVEYRGTYTLSWGEKVGVKDDNCPYAVYTEVSLKYTGTAMPTTEDDDEEEEERTTSSRNNWFDDDEEEEEEDTEDEVSDWEEGDYTNPGKEDTVISGPSVYYPDMNIDQWAVKNVNLAYEYGLMSGTTYGYFEPLRNITRAEFTAIVCRILGLDPDANYSQVFADVTTSDWHFGYVMAAYNAGYVNGKSATSFAPSDYITREEMAVLVSRIIQVTGNEADVYQFADGTDVSAWARIYVSAVNQTGLMTGDQFGQFLPKNNVNRQTVATVAVRLYEYLGN